MGIDETYRLNSRILSIYSEPGHPRLPVTIPQGAFVIVTNGPLDGTRLVDVLWEGRTVMLFTSDLRERATLVDSTRTSVKTA